MRTVAARLWAVGFACVVVVAAVFGYFVATNTSQSVSAPPANSFDALVAAGQQEGTVKVSGPRGLAAFQKALTEPFTAKYNIPVAWDGLGADQVLQTMRATGQNADAPWDVFVGGNDTLMFNLKSAGLLAPIDPALVLPDVKNPNNWSGGSIPYIDGAHTGIAFLQQAGQYFYVDTSKANPEDIKSYRDLLDPRWKGQILITGDPRDAGHGRSVFAFFLAAPGLGQSFINDLITKQDLIIAKNNTTDADQLLKAGNFKVCICNNAQGTDLINSGKPYKKLDPHKVKEGTSVTSSFANLTLPARSAHPNAAKVYVNWLLSADTQLAAAQASKVPSMRTDVARDFIAAQTIPDPSWPSGSNEASLAQSEEASKLATQILGPKAEPPAGKSGKSKG
jgi:iron(III) transport system substrate-binding protein